MPLLTWSNTNVPTVMIGEKCSDHIKKRHCIPTSPPGCKRTKDSPEKCSCPNAQYDSCGSSSLLQSPLSLGLPNLNL